MGVCLGTEGLGRRKQRSGRSGDGGSEATVSHRPLEGEQRPQALRGRSLVESPESGHKSLANGLVIVAHRYPSFCYQATPIFYEGLAAKKINSLFLWTHLLSNSFHG